MCEWWGAWPRGPSVRLRAAQAAPTPSTQGARSARPGQTRQCLRLGEPPPTQQRPQAGDLAAVLEADVQDEAAVVGADEVDEHAATSLDCGDRRRWGQVPPRGGTTAWGVRTPPSGPCLPPRPVAGMSTPVPALHASGGPGPGLSYSQEPRYWPWSPVGWTVTFMPLHTPSPLGKEKGASSWMRTTRRVTFLPSLSPHTQPGERVGPLGQGA